MSMIDDDPSDQLEVIELFYSDISDQKTDELCDEAIKLLDSDEQEYIRKYVFRDDQKRSMLGKFLQRYLAHNSLSLNKADYKLKRSPEVIRCEIDGVAYYSLLPPRINLIYQHLEVYPHFGTSTCLIMVAMSGLHVIALVWYLFSLPFPSPHRAHH